MRMSPIHPVQFIHRGFTSLQSRPTTHGRQQKRPGAQGTTRVSFFCKDFQRVTMRQKRVMMMLMMMMVLQTYYRRKFRSQTSDNMVRWKKQRWEEPEKRREEKRGREEKRREEKKERRREKIREEKESEERVRRKKMQVREKVAKSRNTAFFQWFGAQEGRKVGSLKRRVRSSLGRWEMKNCTPLWREAHLEVKVCKAHQLRSTFGSWDDKVHAVVARSTFGSQNVQNTTVSEHVWKLTVDMSNKCTLLWREAHVEFKSVKNSRVRTTFGCWDVVS